MPDQYLHGVEVIEIDDGARAIKTVKSSVIGLVGTAPQGPVNTPILINGSPTEAVKYFGNHVDGFTIPRALDQIFDQTGANIWIPLKSNPAMLWAGLTPMEHIAASIAS